MKGKNRGNSMQNLIRQANQTKMKMQKLQEELAERRYESSAGNGAVQVRIKGENHIDFLQISPEIFKDADVEILQDMLISTINETLVKAKEDQEAEMAKITGPMNLSGLF